MDKTIIRHKELGSLKQIAEALWSEMLKEVERNGYSDLTLTLEGSYYGIRDIIDINNIEEVRQLKETET